MTHSLHDNENECQQSITKVWPFLISNQSEIWPLLSLCKIFTVFIRYNAHDLFIAAFEMKSVVNGRETVIGISLAHPTHEPVNSVVIGVFNHAPLRLTKIRDQKSLTLSWHRFSRWGTECVGFFFAYHGGQYLIYNSLQPVATHITQDIKSKIIGTLLMLISKMGQWVCLTYFMIINVANTSKKTKQYHREYFMINSRVFECDHKWNNSKWRTGDMNCQVYPYTTIPKGWQIQFHVCCV